MNKHQQRETAWTWLKRRRENGGALDPAQITVVTGWLGEWLEHYQEQAVELERLTGLIQATWLVGALEEAALALMDRACVTCRAETDGEHLECDACRARSAAGVGRGATPAES